MTTPAAVTQAVVVPKVQQPASAEKLDVTTHAPVIADVNLKNVAVNLYKII